MSASKQFSVKKVTCKSPEINEKISELEAEWIVALLRRAGIPKVMINKALKDQKYSAQAWRDYLFDTKGIQITHHAKAHKTEIFQISFETEKKVKVGAWSPPEIVRIKEGKKIKCELHLKYWQII